MAPAPRLCRNCNKETVFPNDRYCTRCGAPISLITWELSQDGETPTQEALRVPEDQPFYLLAKNVGAVGNVMTAVDLSTARNVTLVGSDRHAVAPGATERYPLKLTFSAARGALTVKSEDGIRADWWERRSWKSTRLSLTGRIQQKQERWILSTETLLFPPGVRHQTLTVWNDSADKRELTLDSPEGYRALIDRATPALKPLAVPGGESAEIVMEIQPRIPIERAEREWFLEESLPDIALTRMTSPPREIGEDAVIAIDFGTRNTSIRIRWRYPVVSGIRANQLDSIGDEGDTERFPTVMVLDANRDETIVGTQAARMASLSPGQVRVVNLKSALRKGEEPYLSFHAEWTTAELVARYFEALFARIDAYLDSVSPREKLSRKRLRVRYVLTRPALDVEEEDVAGKAYEAALTRALERCSVSPKQIEFLLEPSAAAAHIARLRSAELQAHQGELIAVVDAGGGTTDIALALVNIEDGAVKLAVKRAYALQAPALPALQAAYTEFDRTPDNEFGGNTLDIALAHSLLHENVLLDTESRPVPPRITLQDTANDAAGRIRRRDFLEQCRRMKEAFVVGSKQFLNLTQKDAGSAQTVPFPDREDYRGIYIDYALYALHLLQTTLRPAVENLRDRMSAADVPPEVRAARVKRVYCVGGTNVDKEVVREFGRAFPGAKPDLAPMTPEERMTAVVMGAVWSGEAVYIPSPLTLTLEMAENAQSPVRSFPLIAEGEPIPTEPILQPFTALLDPTAYPELDARLIATAKELQAPITIGKAYFANPTDGELVVTLQVSLSQQEGIVAELNYDGAPTPLRQWRVALCPENA